MIGEELTIARAVKPFDGKLARRISELAITDGWGVFGHREGTSCMPHTELHSVWAEEAQAKGEAARLNDSKGKLIHDVTGDPESPVFLGVWFDTGRVALAGVEPTVGFQATYERVSE